MLYRRRSVTHDVACPGCRRDALPPRAVQDVIEMSAIGLPRAIAQFEPKDFDFRYRSSLQRR